MTTLRGCVRLDRPCPQSCETCSELWGTPQKDNTGLWSFCDTRYKICIAKLCCTRDLPTLLRNNQGDSGTRLIKLEDGLGCFLEIDQG